MDKKEKFSKLVMEVLYEELTNIDEDTVIATPTGTKDTMTPDQKVKAKKNLDQGEPVTIVKKGQSLNEEGKQQFIVVDTKTEKKVSGPYPTRDQAMAAANKKDLAYGSIRYAVQRETSPINENDEMGDDEECTPAQKVAKLVQEAIDALNGLNETSEDNKVKRHSDNVLKHLNRANEALEGLKGHEGKISERKASDDEKAGAKHEDQVRKHITKKLKNKSDIEPIMQKYGKVARKIKSKVEDPAKAADMIWKHILKENTNA